MNIRQHALLQNMLKDDTYQTIDMLRTLLNCSEKTLRNDIKDINTFLKDNHFETHISTKQGSGVHVSLVNSEETYLHFFLDAKILEIRPELERFYRGMIALLFSPIPYTMDSLAEELYSNRTQLKTDILQWVSMLKTFQLTLVKKSHLSIEGDEEHIRLFVLYYFYQVATSAMLQTIEPYFLQDDEAIFLNIIHMYEYKLGQQFTSNAIHHFCIYLGIMIKRIRLHHEVQNINETNADYEDIKAVIESHFHISMNMNELAFLNKIMESGARQWNLTYIDKYMISSPTRHAADYFMQQLQDMYHYEIAEDVYKPFCILLDTALRREKYNMRVLNYNSNQVKFDYLPIFLSVVKIFFDHEELQNLHVFETEYTRLTMLLIPYFKELAADKKLHVGLIVNCSIEQAYYGKYAIEKALPNILIHTILTEQDMELAPYDEDMYIAFDYLKTSKPYVQISSMIHAQDIEKIKVWIQNYKNSKREHVFLKNPVIKKSIAGTYETLTECIYKDMLSHYPMTLSVEQFLNQIQIVKLFQDDYMIIPFYNKYITNDKHMLYEVEKGLFVEGIRVYHVHVLCIQERSFAELSDYILYYKQHLYEFMTV